MNGNNDLYCCHCYRIRDGEWTDRRPRLVQYTCDVDGCGLSSPLRLHDLLEHKRQVHGYAQCSVEGCEQRETMSPGELLIHKRQSHRSPTPPTQSIQSNRVASRSQILASTVLPISSESGKISFWGLKPCIILVAIEIIIVLSSVILGVTWTCITHPPDVQGGFTMGGFLLVAGTIPVAGIRHLHLHSKRCRCFPLPERHIELQDINGQRSVQ
jgi:hypothetical protein